MIPTFLDALRPTRTLTGPASLTALDPWTRAVTIAWCLLCLAAASLAVRAVVNPWAGLP